MEESAPGRPRLPRIIPVMDIRGGIVVRAIAGRREEYKPLVSQLTNSTDPIIVAEDTRRVVETDQLYVADLDAIGGGPANLKLFGDLKARGFHVWADAGIRTDEDVEALFGAGVDVAIAGLETLREPNDLQNIMRDWHHFRIAFSLDLFDGYPLGDPQYWPREPEAVIELAWKAGVRQMILLDLTRVGVGNGAGTEYLCAWSKNTHRELEIITGGGVRGPEDLPALADAGVDAVLVASALHDGKFGLPEAAL